MSGIVLVPISATLVYYSPLLHPRSTAFGTPAAGAAQINRAALRHFLPDLRQLRRREHLRRQHEHALVLAPDMVGIRCRQFIHQLTQPGPIRRRQKAGCQPAPSEPVHLLMVLCGVLMIRFEPVQLRQRRVAAQPREQRSLLVLRVPACGLVEIVECGLERLPVGAGQISAPSTVAERPQLREEPLNPTVTVSQQRERLRKIGWRCGDCRRHPVTLAYWIPRRWRAGRGCCFPCGRAGAGHLQDARAHRASPGRCCRPSRAA